MIKIPMVIPAGYYFIRRQWKVVIGGILVVGLVAVLSLKLIPLSVNRLWLSNCILSFSGHPVGAFNNQSVIGVLARELIPDSRMMYWLPLEPTPLFAITSKIAVLLLYVPVLIVLLHRWKSTRTKSGYLFEFFVVLVCSLLTSPISWTHYFIILLIPVAFCLDENVIAMKTKGLKLSLFASLVLITPPVDFTLEFFEIIGQRITLSIHFLGVVLFYIFLFALWIRNRDHFVNG